MRALCRTSLLIADAARREKGIGSTTDVGPNQQYDNNKTEVLRLLIVLLSRQIYVSPASLFSKPSLYTLYLVQQTPRRDVLTLLCSLLNTAMNSPSAGTSITNMAGKLPYNHLVFKGEDPRSTLVSACFQVMLVLLDFQSGPARDAASGPADCQTFAPTTQTNSFRYFLMKLVCSQRNSIASIHALSSTDHKTLHLLLKASWASCNSRWKS